MSWRFLWSPRFWLAGPVTFIIAVMVMLGMATWFPKGVADIDNIILPLISFPLIWAVVFFYAYLDRSIRRIALVLSCLAITHAILFAVHFAK